MLLILWIPAFIIKIYYYNLFLFVSFVLISIHIIQIFGILYIKKKKSLLENIDNNERNYYGLITIMFLLLILYIIIIGTDLLFNNKWPWH